VPERRAVALRVGAAVAVAPAELPAPATYDERYDVVFEASGHPASTARALDLIRPGGTGEQVKRKLEMVACHQSQMRGMLPEFPDLLEPSGPLRREVYWTAA
jgi:hypothetical protein